MSIENPTPGAPQQNRHSFAFALCFAVIVGFVVLNQTAAHWGANLADAHMFAYFGWLVTQGERPYVDFWDNKPPGIWWVNAAAMSLMGPGDGGLLLACGAAVTAALFAFVSIAVRVWGLQLLWPAALVGALLLTHGRYECGANRTETFVIAFESLAIAFWLQSRHTDARLTWLGLAGFCAGLAPLFKQAGVAAGAACLAGFILESVTHWRSRDPAASPRDRAILPQILIFCGAAALPPVLAALRLWSQGALGEAYFAIVEFNQAYFAVGDASWTNLLGSTRLYWASAIMPLRWPLAMIAAGILLSLMQRVRGHRPHAPDEEFSVRREVFVILLWGVLAYYLSTVGPGRRPYHFSTTLPAIGILALWPLRAFISHARSSPGFAQRPSMAVCLLMYAAGFYGLVADSWATARVAWNEKPHWYAMVRRAPAPYERQAAAIREHSTPDDRVYVWGWNPGAYRYAYRRAASRFATLEKGSHVGEHARFIVEGAMRDLREHPPRVMLIGLADLASLRSAEPPEFMIWVNEHYRAADTIDGMTLFLRKLDRNTAGS